MPSIQLKPAIELKSTPLEAPQQYDDTPSFPVQSSNDAKGKAKCIESEDEASAKELETNIVLLREDAESQYASDVSTICLVEDIGMSTRLLTSIRTLLHTHA